MLTAETVHTYTATAGSARLIGGVLLHEVLHVLCSTCEQRMHINTSSSLGIDVNRGTKTFRMPELTSCITNAHDIGL